MRTVTGYRDGKAQWSDNQPARGRVTWEGGIHGSLVVGNRVRQSEEPSSLQAMHKKAKRIQKLGDFE